MTKLSSSVTDALTFQSYAPAPAIDGVWTAPLRKSRSDNGSFMEYVRLSEGSVEDAEGFTARQISVSEAAPGRVNAFHIHPREPQNELWTVIAWAPQNMARGPPRGLPHRGRQTNVRFDR